jgi:hypothetical protein
LVIIKSENGNIFGGYTEQSWLSDCKDQVKNNNYDCDDEDDEDCDNNNVREKGEGFKFDLNAFVFSLVNQLDEPIKIRSKKDKPCSIYCEKKAGPVFGHGYDIYIADKSNTNTKSSANLGWTYTHPGKYAGGFESYTFLAGSKDFQVSEIEVYTKQ